jgi:ribose transport system permease protein
MGIGPTSARAATADLVETPAGGPPRLAGRVRKGGQSRPITAATVVLFLLCALFFRQALTATSLLAMLPSAAVLAIAAAGETLVIQQRGIDLSVSGHISLSAILVGVFAARNDTPIWVTLAVVFAMAAAGGFLSGFLVAKLSITPLIATLAVNALLLGVLQAYSGGSPATAPQALIGFASAKWLGQPTIVWTAVIVVIAIAAVSRSSIIGRRFVATGASPVAARAGGVAGNRYLIGAYIGAALCYALAGVLLAGYLKSAATTVGDPYMLTVIAAVVVGGTPLAGGRGSVIASAVAALFLSQLVQLVLTLGAPTAVQTLIQALALALAALLRGLSEGGWLRRLASRSARRQTA